MQIASGRYSGNGSTQDITAPGWQAGFVMVKLLGAQKAAFWTQDMPAASFRPATSAVALTTTGGVTIHASGFTVGNAAELNTNASSYDWIAIRDNSAGDCHISSYTGTGAVNAITGFGFQADAFIVLPGGTRSTWWALSTFAAGNGQAPAGALATGAITSIDSDGVTLPNNSTTNANGETYYYIALKMTELTFRVFTYTGTGSGHDETGAGFTPSNTVPDNAITKHATATTVAAFYGKNYSGQATQLDATSTGTQRISALVGGGFTVGTSSASNTNAVAYHSMVFKDGTTTAAAPTKPPSLGSLLGVQR